MSWQLPHQFNAIYRAVSLALIYPVLGLATAQAATIGETVIKSSQYEPLSASFSVSDIDATEFSASLANPALYQQMGLTPNAAIQVRFIPTSPTTGRVVLTSTQPIATPFTDVVVALNDNGKQQVVPKTLLMPSNNQVKSSQQQNIQADITSQPRLPIVGTLEVVPLQVQDAAPPPLFDEDIVTEQPDESLSAQAQTTADQDNQPAQNDQPILASQNLDNETDSVTATVANKQVEILSTQVIRKVIPAGQYTADQLTAQQQDEQNSQTNEEAQSEAINAKAQSNQTKPTSQAAADEQQKSTKTYVVQRNDNLWTIAETLASQNNLDVVTVMKAIQQQNPDAFVDGKASLLKANATLSLPDYEVVPSQQGMQAAITANRKAMLQAQQNNKVANKAKASGKPATTTARTTARQTQQVARSTHSSQTSINKPLPKAQMTLVTPGQQGSATGTQTQVSAAKGNGGSNTNLVNTLKASRQKTASRAERVNELNDQLSSYTKKVQIQNQKLAELQARLKELKN